jgi:hypothetical protein
MLTWLYSGVPALFINCRLVSFVYLQSPCSASLCARPRRPRRLISRAPAALAPLYFAPRAAPAPRPPLPTPCWPSPCSSTSRRRRPNHHARRRACQHLLSLAVPPPRLEVHPQASHGLTLALTHAHSASPPSRARCLAGAPP